MPDDEGHRPASRQGLVIFPGNPSTGHAATRAAGPRNNNKAKPPALWSGGRRHSTKGAFVAAPYLHDGRAPTILDAILLHGGEGEESRIAFQALSASQQDDILEFLRHL